MKPFVKAMSGHVLEPLLSCKPCGKETMLLNA
jgi:hypothetical protein